MFYDYFRNWNTIFPCISAHALGHNVKQVPHPSNKHPTPSSLTLNSRVTRKTSFLLPFCLWLFKLQLEQNQYRKISSPPLDWVTLTPSNRQPSLWLQYFKSVLGSLFEEIWKALKYFKGHPAMYHCIFTFKLSPWNPFTCTYGISIHCELNWQYLSLFFKGEGTQLFLGWKLFLLFFTLKQCRSVFKNGLAWINILTLETTFGHEEPNREKD